jgi:hypothetical protein
MTSLATYLDTLDNDAAAVDYFDVILTGWEDRERFGDTLVSEDDFPLYDDSADEYRVSDEDWNAMAEVMWTDPAER